MATASPTVLENDLYRVEVEPAHGTVRRILDKPAGFELITEPRLAENFRLLLPLPGLECNYILGTQQKLSGHALRGSTLELSWRGPLTGELGGTFDLDVTLWIELIDDEIHFRCRVRNGTQHKLAEVWFAMIGGMSGLGKSLERRRETWALALNSSKAWQQKLFSDFGNTRGQTLGCPGGEHSFMYPGNSSMPWVSLYNPQEDRAVYFGAHETTPRIKLLNFALMPGLAEHRAGGNWPRPQDVGDLPFGLVMNWTHVPYTKPGETFDSATAVLRCHRGGWRESAESYRKWFTSQYPLANPRENWMRRTTAFLHTMFLLPQDNVILTFKQIPQWAKSAAEHGVKHLMIAGWNVGGHDRGYPYYEPDPRLGTWDELQAGIRAAHDLNLKVSFFVNCQPIDMTTEWYQRELHRYRIVDPTGVQYFVTNYWGMGTLSARNRFFTATANSEMNPAHPEVRQLLIRQFRRLVEIGADGVHIDKFFQTPMDFNPKLAWTSPDRAHHEGCLQFVNELIQECRQINPEFCFSFEGNWDRLFSHTDVMWWGNGDEAVVKEVFPQVAMICGIEQPYDFNKANRAILQGQHFLIGPANYTRGMDYPPMQTLFQYLHGVTRIRDEHLDLFSLGKILDTSQGICQQNQPTLRLDLTDDARPRCRWTVFGEVNGNRRGIVMVNASLQPLTVTGLWLADQPDHAWTILDPQTPSPRRLTGEFTIAAERAVFLV